MHMVTGWGIRALSVTLLGQREQLFSPRSVLIPLYAWDACQSYRACSEPERPVTST